MPELNEGFLTRSFLRSNWALDYAAFKGSPEEKALEMRLKRWAGRTDLKETSAESAFLQEFFVETWDYVQTGQDGGEKSFSLYPKFPVPGAGQKGGPGEADAALGEFTSAKGNLVPQVVCEFKDIKSSLDAPQKRKGNNRSPVQQGLDYLSFARRGLFGNEPILPTWAIITDMNEFRLYWADRGKRQFMRFTIKSVDLFQGASLIAETEDARFERFLFFRLFHADTLLVRGASGRSQLAQLIAQQWVRERKLENDFYKEYRAYREHLYQAMLGANPEGTPRFPGTRGQLVRMAQKILDRCIFIFYCEDMGRALGYPPQLLRNFLIEESNLKHYDPDEGTIWLRLCSLFRAMNDGTAFGGQKLNQFNGGLFAADTELETLVVPNRVFCQQGQGQNEAGLYAFPLTLLYLSASYNYASNWAEGLTSPPVAEKAGEIEAGRKADPEKALGLYTLGRIFEQSITELEILEAEADGRLSLNKVDKRKRDGVYYTPEWAIDFIVSETLGGRLEELKNECGWPPSGSEKLPDENAVLSFEEKLKQIKIVDPACGSGAFLITALRYLLDEWAAIQELRKQVSKNYRTREGDTDRIVRDILRDNLYGVDINPASVEITKLALWLHTARGDKPLSSLDDHIRDGNSLIGNNFYDNLAPYTAEQQERINAFDWEEAFPQVFENGGRFDVVVGNPPYVKLQNFRKVHADMADFLRTDAAGNPSYEATQTGNFDLYLPFVEKGIQLLNEHGRLGYIAPSLWTLTENGQGLRDFIMRGRHLYGWIDFQSWQVFEEATTYTALQFYTRASNDKVKIAFVPDGVLGNDPWSGNDATIAYERLSFGDRWLMTTGADRALIDHMYARSRRLDDPGLTRNIFVGIQTSADSIYHLKKLGPGRYLCTPKGESAPPPYEVAIEDVIMKPLVSGTEAKRYIAPLTDTYLLFPYQRAEGNVRLISAVDMVANYPLAWAYLCSWEADLRARESNKMDVDDGWWGYNYPKNLDKQEIEKLVVAQTVPSMRVCADPHGEFYINNVRVNGISAAAESNLFYLLGILNSPACDHVFRRAAKPKDGGWFEANKQFIDYLPIPVAGEPITTDVADRAERLQQLHTRRRDLLVEIDRRLSVAAERNKPERWLFPGLKSKRDLKDEAPARLEDDKKKEWAKQRYDEALAACHERVGAGLAPGIELDASFENGELRFLVAGSAVIEQIFVTDQEGEFIVAQWKLLASTYSITDKTNGKKLANALRKIRVTDNPAIVSQVIERQQELAALQQDLTVAEVDLNEIVFRLYDLNAEQVRRVMLK